LLGICGTQQQRRLLRAQGYVGFVLFFVLWCLKIEFGIISCFWIFEMVLGILWVLEFGKKGGFEFRKI
jgi:hypothetical protein